MVTVMWCLCGAVSEMIGGSVGGSGAIAIRANTQARWEFFGGDGGFWGSVSGSGSVYRVEFKGERDRARIKKYINKINKRE